MHQEIKKDVLAILERAIDILEVKEIRDVLELKELSDRTLHNASIFQDHDSISIGVLIYALAKIFERDFHGATYKKVLQKLRIAKDTLKKNDIDNYRLQIKDLFSIIQTVDFKIKRYIQEVLQKARINKGSKLFAHGISLARVSKMLNITRWELMNYVGKTRIVDYEPPGAPIRQRIKLTRKLFP